MIRFIVTFVRYFNFKIYLYGNFNNKSKCRNGHRFFN